MNERMTGKNTQVPTGANPSYPAGAPGSYETVEQRLDRLVREDMALAGLPWAASLKRVWQSAVDTKLKALASRWLAAGPRTVMAEKITSVMAVDNCEYRKALDAVKLSEPALVEAAALDRPRQSWELLDDTPAKHTTGGPWVSAYRAAIAGGRTETQARAAADAAMAGQGANTTTLTTDEQKLARSLGLDVTTTSRRALRAAFQRELEAEPELRREVAQTFRLPEAAPIDELVTKVFPPEPERAPEQDDQDPLVQAAELMKGGLTLAQVRDRHPQLSERLVAHYDAFGQSRRQPAQPERHIALRESESARTTLARLAGERAERDGCGFSEAVRRIATDQPLLWEASTREYPGA